jgi:hypothetical protein
MVKKFGSNTAFIFTMDAIIALIPVFIILATVSQVNPASASLELQSRVLEKEKRVNDILEVLFYAGLFEEENVSYVEEVLEDVVTPYYNYSYTVEYNGSAILNFSRGNISRAKDVTVSKKTVSIYVEKIVGEVRAISRTSKAAEPCYKTSARGRGIGGQVFLISFNTSDLNFYDYWFVAELDESTQGGQPHKVMTLTQNISCEDAYNLVGSLGTKICGPGWAIDGNLCKILFPFDGNPVGGTSNWSSYTTYYTYIRLQGIPSAEASFYIIEAPKDTEENAIAPETAAKKKQVIITLKLWEEE